MWGNQITFISSNSFNSPSAKSVTIYLSENRITSHPSGAFSYPSGTKADIWLSSNQIIDFTWCFFRYESTHFVRIFFINDRLSITYFANGWILFYAGNFATINLNNNKLTEFKSDVFKNGTANSNRSCSTMPIWLGNSASP